MTPGIIRHLPCGSLRHRVDLDAGVAGPQRVQSGEDVVLEQRALEVGRGVLGGVEAVQHLHVLVAHEQVLRERAGDGAQERPAVVGVDLGGGGTLVRVDDVPVADRVERGGRDVSAEVRGRGPLPAGVRA